MEGLGCGCKIVPLLQQRNVNLWETVKAGCIVMVQLQKIRLNDCTVHHNELNGLHACDRARVDLGGTNMEVHSNKRSGIRAHCCAKVNIHLPSQHNTSHDNVGQDRYQARGGSIANINADGTFTHT